MTPQNGSEVLACHAEPQWGRHIDVLGEAIASAISDVLARALIDLGAAGHNEVLLAVKVGINW